MPIHRTFALTLLLITPPSFAAERFSGSANLAVNKTQSSVDQRFSVTAELQAAPLIAQATTDGRFSLLAELTAPKSLATACEATDLIFQNGFEN